MIDHMPCAIGGSLALLALGSTFCACAPTAPLVSARSVAQPSGPASRSEASQHTRLSLPFEGTWIVGQGYHGSESHSGRAAYALDLVKVGTDGRAHVHQGRRTKDWYGFGADVLATADGVVVRAIDQFPDNRVMGKARDVNTLIIRHGREEFSEYVHLQRGSLGVRIGEPVLRGQVLARCGNSGSETPHLHWALLSSLDPIRTRPAVFADYELRDDQGTWQPASGTPSSGDVIRQRSRHVQAGSAAAKRRRGATTRGAQAEDRAARLTSH